MNRNTIAHTLLTAAILLVVFIETGCRPRPTTSPPRQDDHEEDEINVAVLIDLSGPQSSLGKPAYDGFKLAMQEGANTPGQRVWVTPWDTETDNVVTEKAARDMAPTATVGAGFTNNESVLVAGPIFQREGKPFLSIGATDPALPTVVGDRIFLACFGDNTQAAAAAEFACRELGDTTVVLWDSRTPYTRMLPKYFRLRFEQLSGQSLLDESFSSDDLTDLGQQISKLPTPPAFVYLAAMPENVGELIASLRAAGVDAPIVGGDGLDTPDVLTSESGPTTDVWFTTHAWLSSDSGTPRAKAFVQAYEQEYGYAPRDAFAALGYDSANLLLDVIKRAEGTSPDQVTAALAATRDFEGVTGTISYGDGQHVPHKTVWIVKVEDGRQTLATSLVPESVPPPIVSGGR